MLQKFKKCKKFLYTRKMRQLTQLFPNFEKYFMEMCAFYLKFLSCRTKFNPEFCKYKFTPFTMCLPLSLGLDLTKRDKWYVQVTRVSRLDHADSDEIWPQAPSITVDKKLLHLDPKIVAKYVLIDICEPKWVLVLEYIPEYLVFPPVTSNLAQKIQISPIFPIF